MEQPQHAHGYRDAIQRGLIPKIVAIAGTPSGNTTTLHRRFLKVGTDDDVCVMPDGPAAAILRVGSWAGDASAEPCPPALLYLDAEGTLTGQIFPSDEALVARWAEIRSRSIPPAEWFRKSIAHRIKVHDRGGYSIRYDPDGRAMGLDGLAGEASYHAAIRAARLLWDVGAEHRKGPVFSKREVVGGITTEHEYELRGFSKDEAHMVARALGDEGVGSEVDLELAVLKQSLSGRVDEYYRRKNQMKASAFEIAEVIREILTTDSELFRAVRADLALIHPSEETIELLGTTLGIQRLPVAAAWAVLDVDGLGLEDSIDLTPKQASGMLRDAANGGSRNHRIRPALLSRIIEGSVDPGGNGPTP